MSFEIDEKTKQEKLKKINDRLDRIEKDLADPLGSMFVRKSEFYLDWAETLEQKYILESTPALISQISNYIRTELKIRGYEAAIPHMHDVLPDKYKNYKPNIDMNNDEGPDPKKIEPVKDSILITSLQVLQFHNKRFNELIQKLIDHIRDPEIHKDMCDSIEWEDFALMCASIEKLNEPDGVADLIDQQLNVKEIVDKLRLAFCKFFQPYITFRNMAFQFGIVPRQHQRVRKRLDEWPEKDVKKVIQQMLGSYACPCKCGVNMITRKKIIDITNKKLFDKYRMNDKNYQIPNEYKNKGLDPIQIAEMIWMKKFKLVEID